MNAIETVIFQNYLQYKEILQTMEKELELLPKGNLTYRIAHNRRYCYLQHWSSEGKPCNVRVPDEEIQKMEQAIVRRDMLAENIKILHRHLHKLEKEFPSFCQQTTSPVPTKAVPQTIQKPYSTLKGDLVRSKSEVIIANELYIANIPYEYEKPLYLEGYEQPFLPDFTIQAGNKVVYWEHCGLMSDEKYRTKWDRKKRVYEKFGISEWNRTLIVTYETYAGSLNLVDIRQHIAQLQWF